MNQNDNSTISRRTMLKSASALLVPPLASCGGGGGGGDSGTNQPVSIQTVVTSQAQGDFAVKSMATTVNTTVPVTIRNTGSVPFNWTIGAQDNVTVTPSSGLLSAGASVDISVTASAAGTYTLTGALDVAGTKAAITTSLAVTTPVVVATAFTLYVPEGGTNGTAATVIVTANGPMPAGGAVVTLTASNNAALGIAILAFPAGATAVQTTTITRSVDGASAITMTNSAGLANNGSPANYTSAAPVAGGTWVQLSVAPHERRVITAAGDGTVTTFNPIKALAVEVQPIQTVNGIPSRAFSLPVPGERGVVYITGGLHSNYQGNEIDRLAMPVGDAFKEITTQISHQPNMPPEGPYSGYASGNGGYIYRQFGGGTPDPTNWQPYPGHQWTKNGWHPEWGFFSLTAHALTNTDGSVKTAAGVPLSSAAQPGDVLPPNTPVAKEDYGVVGFDWSTKKYKTFLSTVGQPFPQSLLGQTGVTDWNNWDQSVVFLQTNGGTTYLQIHRMGGTYGLSSLTSTSVVGGYDGHGGNGILARSLEQRKYLLLRQDGSGAFKDRAKLMIYSEDFGTGDARFKTLTIPLNFTSDIVDNVDGLSFTVDKNSRRVFWLVFPNVGVPVRFYVSTFESLTNWTPITFSPDIIIPNLPFRDAWIAANRQPLVFRDGYLYLADNSDGIDNSGFNNGTMNWKRVKVDAGEDLPTLNFQRHDYRKQNFQFSSDPGTLQLWGVKHTNWAYRPADGKHYLMAGDMGSSTTHSRATLQFGVTANGYQFVETNNETDNPAPGKFQPSSCDDGHWFLVPDTSPWVAGRGKFVWMRGGDGEPMFYNAYLRRKYGSQDSNGTAAQISAAKADGWDIAAKLYLFDPATQATARGFDKIDGSASSYDSGGSAWTQDNGGTYFPDVWTASSSASRNGAFDGTTGVLWRFYNTGSPSLAAFDFVNRVVKFYSTARWLSPDTGRNYYTSGAAPATVADLVSDGSKTSFGNYDASSGRYVTPLGLEWEHKATWLDDRDGKLYAVNPVTGYLWCFETRGTVTNTGDGRVLPFYPVGQRIPLVGVYPSTNARNSYPPVLEPGKDSRMQQFLVPFKGGLLWWGSTLHDSGTFGYPRYAFWRRLGFTGAWTVVTMPQEFAANTFSVVSKSINNSEVILLSGGGNTLDTQGPWPYFWRLT